MFDAVKVLHIAPTPFFSNRGCHIRIRNEIDGLTEKGTRIVLCTYGLGKDVEGIDIRRIPSIPGYKQTKAGFSPYKFLADFLLFFLVLKTAWREKPDIFHGHLHEGALIGWAVKTLFFWRRIPLLMDMQGSLSGELEAYGVFKKFPFILRWFFFLEKMICAFPTVILCSSENCYNFLVTKCAVPDNKGSVLIDVVPDSFFDPCDSSDLREKYSLPDDKKIIIYTGSLLHGKGVDFLLEAMKELVAKRDDLFFILVGYPVEDVESYVQKTGLEKHCLVAGEVAYDDLALWLSVAQLAVDPKADSSGEASGKILHYMASGLPVVCFDTVNNRKYLNKHAFFAKNTSSVDLGVMIEKGVDDTVSAALFAEKGREKVKKEYSLGAAAESLHALYLSRMKPVVSDTGWAN